MFLDTKAYEKITKDLPKIAVLTVAILCEKYKINGSLARKILKEFCVKGLVKLSGEHNHHISIYTGTQVGKVDPKDVAPVKGKKQEKQSKADKKAEKEEAEAET